jgi:hypothetical protein
VIGPDHPYGSQPFSLTANQNNLSALAVRPMVPHVAAHIVNDQLGGPGEAQNLFAFPGTANTRMEQTVEGNMKDAVAAGHYIHYTADVHHPATGPADYITMSWNKLDDNGNDIGGGQTGTRINADATTANAAVGVLAGGTAGSKPSLRQPASPNLIKATPWGPFQMPDPKQSVALNAFLDLTSFPAVGNKDAFVGFLTTFKGSRLQLQVLMDSINDPAAYKSLGRWITSKNSTIKIKTRRGVTQDMVNGLLSATRADHQEAFIEIMASGDAPAVIGAAAAQFANSARRSARSKV